MGNEMGNNNVSGLQEEEKARTEEDQGKFLQDDNHADELKGENVSVEDTKGEDNTYLIGESTNFHGVLSPSKTPLEDLAVEKPLEGNETSNGNEEHDTEFKPVFVPVEIPPDSNDADLRSEDQEFVSSEIADFLEKTNLDDNLLTAEHGSKKEMLIEGEDIEAKNQIIDSKAGSGEWDPNSDQQEVVQSEQVAEGITIPESENGHFASNKVTDDMYLCVKLENGDQNVATIMDTSLVKAKGDEDEFQTLPCKDKIDVINPDEINSQNEHNVDQSPLNALQPPHEAHESTAEASYQQQEALNLPVEGSDAPIDTMNSPLETLQPPLEALELPQEASHPQPLALPLLMKASDSPLEESEAPLDALNPTIKTLEIPLEASESPLEASDPEPLALVLLVKPSDPLLEASNLPSEASEPPRETSESSEALEPPEEAVESRLEIQIEGSKLPLETMATPLEASDTHLEAFPQASLINSSQEVYEPNNKTVNVTEAILITSERQNEETKLANNQAQISEENDQKFETIESETSQSEQMCFGSDCAGYDSGNALVSSVEKACVLIESDVHNDEPQVALHNQTLKPCLKEQAAMEESMPLPEDSIIGSEVESKENQGDHSKTEFCDQELKDLKTDDSLASELEFLATETDSKKSAEQSMHEANFTNGIRENCQLEDLDGKCSDYQVTSADKSLQLISSEVGDIMSEIKAVSTESNATEYKHHEELPREETGDEEKESIGKSMSPTQDLPPYYPDSEALEDKNELIVDSKSEISITGESFHASPIVAIMQTMTPTPEQDAEQNIQETSVMAETSLLFDEKNMGQVTVEKLMTEPSLDNASNHVEFRKSPSFHFNLSDESKCEESDQTPLLSNDSSTGRSLKTRDEAMMHKHNAQSGHNAAEDEVALVEEKTIRMERSDSERPSAPFLSFLQKQESAEIVVPPEEEEKRGANRKTKKDPWTVIHKTFALTSPRESNGKRKAKSSSIFSTCICCASKIT
ncbi:uncharacterized protein LOC108225529 isoform X3 [Daucus carota subsp. sativus]|uniref:uncharacterized protein LOC108225529 isoform X3 n=1 Tax=Daucus carota subsp. sativus TaxID=79200 RepID=UPI003083BAA4